MKKAILAATITAIALIAIPAGANTSPCKPVGIGVDNDTVVKRPIGKGVVP